MRRVLFRTGVAGIVVSIVVAGWYWWQVFILRGETGYSDTQADPFWRGLASLGIAVGCAVFCLFLELTKPDAPQAPEDRGRRQRESEAFWKAYGEVQAREEYPREEYLD